MNVESMGNDTLYMDPVNVTPTRDYTLANTIITGVSDITKSILGLVAVSKTADAAASATPGAPAPGAVVTAAPGISTPMILAVGIPAALVGVALVMRK